MSSRRPGVPPPTGRRRWRAAPGLLAVVIGAALLLASCSSGGNASSAGTTTTTSGPHSTTPTRAVPTTTTSRPTSSTTGTAAGGTTCQPAQLAAAAGQATGAAGTIAMTISLTNSSPTTCTLEGYPGMQLLDANGGDLPTTVVRDQFHFPDPAADQPPSLVTLAPHATGMFGLSYEDVPVGNETSCPTSAQAEVTPPNDFTHLVMPLQIAPCANGTVHVSPVYAGS